MPLWMAAVIQWIERHLSPQRLSIITVALTAILLFAPGQFLKYFGLDAFAQSHRGIISLFFGGSLILLVSYPVSVAWNLGKKALQDYRYQRQIKKYFESLGSDEIAILLQYAESGKSSIRFSRTNGCVRGLVDKRILYIP